jgi:L-serine/L-threonine ammonia-lyase
MVGKLRDLGADVLQTGENWAAADKHLREALLANHDPQGIGIYVPPFDHPDIWSGASTLVEEMVRQMRDAYGNPAIDAIVCSVGGGGLLCGVMEGVESMRKQGGTRDTPKVLAMETVGADSLNASVKAGKLVTLPAISSIATSLGAPRVAEKAFEWTERCGDDLISATVTDAEAVMGSVCFLDDARMLVEVACGATIATAYNGMLRKHLGTGLTDTEWSKKNVVLVVCGGSNVNMDVLANYKHKYGV